MKLLYTYRVVSDSNYFENDTVPSQIIDFRNSATLQELSNAVDSI